MLIGEPGIGKTMIINNLQDTGKYHVLTIRLVNEDEGTMIGYADPGGSDDTVILRVTRKVKDSVIAAKEANKRLIVFFDEINRAKEHMIKCVFNIIDTKRWGDLQLPDSTSFIAAMNPPTANHKVRDILSDTALRRRFVVYAIKADAKEYIAYAKNANIHPSVISFLIEKPDCVYDYAAMDNGFPYACPASWDTVSDILKWHAKEGTMIRNIQNSPSVRNMLHGLIGSGMAHQFMDFMAITETTLTSENILLHYNTIRPHVLTAVNDEFTEEDATVDSSKLTQAATSLGTYVAHQIVNEDFHLFVSKQDGETLKMDTATRVKCNLHGKNLSAFLNDCPASVIQSFFSAQHSALESITDNPQQVTAALSKLQKLIHYSDYVAATNKLANITYEVS